jgi:hypothetical protein
MATTTNYGWTTPDNTALVKDGASAIRTLGSSIDTTLKAQIDAQIPDTLLTTTGDVIYASAANTPARLGVGSTGQVLTVAGGVPTWATPSGGSSSYSLINTGGTAMSGSTTVTVSSIPSRNNLFVQISGFVGSTNSQITIRFNADSGANYTCYGLATRGNSSATPTQIAPVNDTSLTSINIGKLADGGTTGGSGGLWINGANSTGIKFVSAASGMSAQAGSGENQIARVVQGYYSGTSAISSISVITSGTNFTAGTIFVYGSVA